MEVSGAAVMVAYYVAFQKRMPDTLSFQQAARELEDDGHLVLVFSCNDPKVIKAFELKNLEPAVNELPFQVVNKYRISTLSPMGNMLYLKTREGRYARVGVRYNNLLLTKVEGKKLYSHLEVFHPSAMHLEWV